MPPQPYRNHTLIWCRPSLRGRWWTLATREAATPAPGYSGWVASARVRSRSAWYDLGVVRQLRFAVTALLGLTGACLARTNLVTEQPGDDGIAGGADPPDQYCATTADCGSGSLCATTNLCVPDPCVGITCPEYGTCVLVTDVPECQCQAGYVTPRSTFDAGMAQHGRGGWFGHGRRCLEFRRPLHATFNGCTRQPGLHRLV